MEICEISGEEGKDLVPLYLHHVHRECGEEIHKVAQGGETRRKCVLRFYITSLAIFTRKGEDVHLPQSLLDLHIDVLHDLARFMITAARWDLVSK